MGGIQTTYATLGFGLIMTRTSSLYPIAEITDVSGPSMSLKTVDVTSHGSANMYSEWIPGFKDGGDLTLTGNFYAGDTNGQVGLQSDFENRTQQTYALSLANGASWGFTGFCTKFEITNPLEKQMEFKVTIKLVGKPTFTTTASVDATTIAITSMGGILTPAWSPTKYLYAYAATTNGTITVTDTTAASISLYINGAFSQSLATGVASTTLTIAAQTFYELRVVCTDTGKTPKTYIINVARAA